MVFMPIKIIYGFAVKRIISQIQRMPYQKIIEEYMLTSKLHSMMK